MAASVKQFVIFLLFAGDFSTNREYHFFSSVSSFFILFHLFSLWCDVRAIESPISFSQTCAPTYFFVGRLFTDCRSSTVFLDLIIKRKHDRTKIESENILDILASKWSIYGRHWGCLTGQ